jgi:hypothetical protein
LRNCVRSVDSFALAAARRIRPRGIEAR